MADVPRFLCDEMLQRLGRWLRAAGYDTLIAQDAEADYWLLRRAIDEGRLLVTRDRELLDHRRAPGNVIFLDTETLEECARALTAQVPVDWLYQPFCRCLVCNTPLVDATREQLDALALSNKEDLQPAYYCPECRQVFWEGSHVRRMRHHLQDWQERFSTNPSEVQGSPA